MNCKFVEREPLFGLAKAQSFAVLAFSSNKLQVSIVNKCCRHQHGYFAKSNLEMLVQHKACSTKITTQVQHVKWDLIAMKKFSTWNKFLLYCWFLLTTKCVIQKINYLLFMNTVQTIHLSLLLAISWRVNRQVQKCATYDYYWSNLATHEK